MGTWSSDIFGNDTSCEVKEFFFTEYNQGKEPEAIYAMVLTQFEFSLNNEEDKYNVLLALGSCLWETQSLHPNLFNTIKHIVEDGLDLVAWKSLEADEKTLKERDKHLKKFLSKLSTPKSSPKKRIKPPVQIACDYTIGSCLCFCYPNGNYGGIIIIDCEFFKHRGQLRFALTTIDQASKPTLESFLSAKLATFSWEWVYGQAHKYAAFEDFTARISTHALNYNKETKNNFFAYNAHFFDSVGTLPRFTQCLLSTVGGGTLYDKTYADFEKSMSAYLSYYLHEKPTHEKPSQESIEALIKLIVKG